MDIFEAQLDKPVTIADVDDTGEVAIRFEDTAGATQTFWIESRRLRRLLSGKVGRPRAP